MSPDPSADPSAGRSTARTSEPATVPLGRLPTKQRMAIDRQAMPERDAEARSHSFDEVNLGFEAEVALLESQRCLLCKQAHCVKGCPVGVDIPAFIGKVAEGDLRAAADHLLACNALPGVTGRVCPQETQCEGECPRGATLRGVTG